MRNVFPVFIFLFSRCVVFRVSQLCPGAVLQKLDKLVEPLKLTCTTKVKANSVKQEYEKQVRMDAGNLCYSSIELMI